MLVLAAIYIFGILAMAMLYARGCEGWEFTHAVSIFLLSFAWPLVLVWSIAEAAEDVDWDEFSR